MKTEKKAKKEKSNSDEKKEDQESIEERGANSKKEFKIEDDQASLDKKSSPVHHQPPAEMKVDLTVEKQSAPKMTVEHVEKLELRDEYDDGAIDIGQPTENK